jgi:hypothetical protein
MHQYANKILSYRVQEFHKLKLMDLVRMELSKPNIQIFKFRLEASRHKFETEILRRVT